MDDEALLGAFSLYIWPMLALVSVLALIPLGRHLARRLELVDSPGGRKEHVGHIPLIGGLVIFSVFIVFDILANAGVSSHLPLYLSLIILLVTGVVDDKYHIAPFFKFAMQIIAAAIAVFIGGAQLNSLGNILGLGVLELGILGPFFSLVAMVLLINAINLMDGLDGLAGGVGFIIIGWMFYAALGTEAGEIGVSKLILMAALLGFLVYNIRSPWRRKASVFMGDAGSMCLGLVIGWFAIKTSPDHGGSVEPIAIAWVLAIPIWDECAQFYRRVREGRHPFSPDRGHLHHHFLKAGLSVRAASTCIISLVFLCGLFGVSGSAFGLPNYVLTSIWIVGILAHIYFSRKLDIYPRFIGKLFNPLIRSSH